jgi:hypothetical protein
MLQKKGVAAMRLGPGDGQQFGVPIGVFESRHLRNDDGFKLHGVQMPPASFLVSMEMQPLHGGRIGPDALPALHFHLHPLGLHIDAHLFDFPWRLDSDGVREKLFVVHPTSISTAPPATTTASSFCKNPQKVCIGLLQKEDAPPRTP